MGVCVCRVCESVLYLHVKALLKAQVYMILWFIYNAIDVVNSYVLFGNFSDTTSEFLHGDNKDDKDLLSKTETKHRPILWFWNELPP